jgi:hypothetical protein
MLTLFSGKKWKEYLDERIVLINVGWMVRYRGLTNDPTLGGFGWLKAHDYGHEAWNFLPVRGRLYGYVPRSAQIRLTRLGAGSRDEKIAGVTVVWIARSPRTGETFVIGWYRNATIHKNKDHLMVRRSPTLRVEYQIEAAEPDATLLDVEQRVLKVPTEKRPGNLGQSPVWYGNVEFLQEARQYLKTRRVIRKTRAHGRSGAKPRQPDPLLRKKIEAAAVQHAIRFYESKAGGHYAVRSVEGDRIGWDLEAKSGDVTLLIEVKGLSGGEINVELTPNEYQKMMSPKLRRRYVMYVVTRANTAHDRSHVFYYNLDASSEKRHVWAAEDGRVLDIQPRTAARLSVA